MRLYGRVVILIPATTDVWACEHYQARSVGSIILGKAHDTQSRHRGLASVRLHFFAITNKGTKVIRFSVNILYTQVDNIP